MADLLPASPIEHTTTSQINKFYPSFNISVPIPPIVTDDDALEDLLKDLDSHDDLSKAAQTLDIQTEERRYGKAVTIVEGFDQDSVDVSAVASDLKSQLATGGTYEADRIELQGDHVDHVQSILRERGFDIRT